MIRNSILDVYPSTARNFVLSMLNNILSISYSGFSLAWFCNIGTIESEREYRKSK
jgi:hypothetical protein